MTLVLDATPKGAAANSYATLAEANAVLEAYFDTSSWTTAADALKTQALIAATLRLEQETYRGWPTTTTQALKWPRNGLYKEATGPAWSYDVVPAPVKQAQASLALYFLQLQAAGISTVVAVDPDLAWIKEISIAGAIDVTYRDQAAGTAAGALPADVSRLLAGFITSGQGQFALVRG